MSTQIEITRIIVELEQEGNTDGTTEEYEKFNIIFEYPLRPQDGHYMVIKSNTGWSINDTDELEKTIRLIEGGITNIETDLVDYYKKKD